MAKPKKKTIQQEANELWFGLWSEAVTKAWGYKELYDAAESSRRHWVDEYCKADQDRELFKRVAESWQWSAEFSLRCPHDPSYVTQERVHYVDGGYRAIVNRCFRCHRTWMSDVFITGTMLRYTRWRFIWFAIQHPVRVWRSMRPKKENND